jgi:hypothetical protein
VRAVRAAGHISHGVRPTALRPTPWAGAPDPYFLESEGREWFHGFISYEETLARLEGKGHGAFLFRFSESRPGSLVVAFVVGADEAPPAAPARVQQSIATRVDHPDAGGASDGVRARHPSGKRAGLFRLGDREYASLDEVVADNAPRLRRERGVAAPGRATAAERTARILAAGPSQGASAPGGAPPAAPAAPRSGATEGQPRGGGAVGTAADPPRGELPRPPLCFAQEPIAAGGRSVGSHAWDRMLPHAPPPVAGSLAARGRSSSARASSDAPRAAGADAYDFVASSHGRGAGSAPRVDMGVAGGAMSARASAYLGDAASVDAAAPYVTQARPTALPCPTHAAWGAGDALPNADAPLYEAPEALAALPPDPQPSEHPAASATYEAPDGFAWPDDLTERPSPSAEDAFGRRKQPSGPVDWPVGGGTGVYEVPE